ncbi:MAG: hypothetical protein JKX98_12320 [Alcanivoracaceae bacterium]|nr:hypothetical protein [Alcanivoracaceae bacterium]
MKKYQLRKDRFVFFDSFEKPQFHMTLKYECPNFLDYCKHNKLPPFHFFLYCLCQGIKKVDNFCYRIYENEVIKVDKFIPTYTVVNKNNDVNFAKLYACDDLDSFIKASLKTRNEAMQSEKLINVISGENIRELKNALFITCFPWFDYSSIDYPVFQFKSADIPSFAWGKFLRVDEAHLEMHFSAQAHHGFVDGFHIHLLLKEISKVIEEIIFKSKNELE